jgi:hypothetical protein
MKNFIQLTLFFICLTLACQGSDSENCLDLDECPGVDSISDKADLANDMLHNQNNQDRLLQSKIINVFYDAGYTGSPKENELILGWPFKDLERHVLSREGTPIIYNTGIPMGNGGFSLHSGTDITRSSESVSPNVYSPVNGIAALFSEQGEKGCRTTYDAYRCAVVVWNPESNIYVLLGHVRGSWHLHKSDFEFVHVDAGDLIGRAAEFTTGNKSIRRQFLHTHMTLFDARSKEAYITTQYNTMNYLPYEDTTPPVIFDLHLANKQGLYEASFKSGRYDVIVDTADRDDNDVRNFGIAGVTFEVTSAQGKSLINQVHCDFWDFLKWTSANAARSLLNFGATFDQIYNNDDLDYADFDNPDRRFHYALTALHMDKGLCVVQSDDAGFIEITDEMTSLNVNVTVWDHHNNKKSFSKSFQRAMNP